MRKKHVFLGNWGGISDVARDFQCDETELEGSDFIIAGYSYEDYSGSAYVLFEKDGKVYEVSGGHCSCDGLEGQWEPYEMTAEAISHILENGCYYRDYFPQIADELRRWINRRKRKSAKMVQDS